MNLAAIAAIDVDALVREAIDREQLVDVAADVPAEATAPFVAETKEGRLDEIDAAIAKGPADDSADDAGDDAADDVASRGHVAPALREMPGGEAFGALMVSEAAVTDLSFRAWPGIRALYHKVSTFLARLRDGIFGFRAHHGLDDGAAMTVRTQLDSDVTVTVHARVLSSTVGAAVGERLAGTLTGLAAALEVFAKVVRIIAGVVLAASSPWHAIKALWHALRKLYDLLVAAAESATGWTPATD